MTRLMVLVPLLVIVILSAIALLHVYWLFGGRWGASGAVPEVNGRPTFEPGPTATLVVALLLLSAALLIAMRAELIGSAWLPSFFPRVGTWVIAVVFLLRAVGDFRRIGLFKRDRASRFARLDALVYSPLSLLLSLGCLWVALRA